MSAACINLPAGLLSPAPAVFFAGWMINSALAVFYLTEVSLKVITNCICFRVSPESKTDSLQFWYIDQYYINIISADVTKICNGGRVSHILTSFISNISALISEHFTY